MGSKQHETTKEVASEATQRLALLTPRERDVLQRIVEGNKNKQIAYVLGISVRTVEVHRAHMMRCIGARHVADAIRLALIAGPLNGFTR